MATSLRTQIQLDILALLADASPKEGAIGGRIEQLLTLTNGTSAGQADKVYYAERTLGATSNEVLDLAGVLTDPLGGTLTFAKIKLIAIQNTDTVDGEDLAVGPDATAGWGAAGFMSDASDRIRVNAGGFFYWYDPNGIAVTGGAADEINIATLVGAVTYRILIVGTST